MAVEQALVTASPQASSIIPSSSPSFDPILENLNQLLHSRAEVFASPSATSSSSAADGGQSIHEDTLKATKYLFDSSLKAEPESFKILARLLSDIRQSSYTPKIETRSKSSQRQSQVAAATAAAQGKGKGKGKASSNSNNSEWSSNPLFRPTSLQELYIDTNTTTTTSTTAASSDDDDSASTTDTNGIGAGATEDNNAVASTSNFNAVASSKSIVDAELDLQLIWEQLELRNGKVLEIVKEIVHDGDDEADDDDENGAEGFDDDDDDDDSDEDEFGLEGDKDDDGELMNGLEDEDEEDEDEMDYSGEDYEDGTDSLDEEEYDDQSMEDEDDDDDEPLTPRSLSKPYFAKLRDASSPDLSSSPEKPPLKKGKKKGSKASSSSSTATFQPESEADDGLFSLKDFNSQVLAGEDEMNRYIQSGKSKSINDLRSGIDGLGEDLDNESDNEEIDYFASDAGGVNNLDGGIGSDDEDEDEEEDDEDEDDEEGGIRPEDMRYNDFWEAPSKVYTKRRDDDYAPSKNGKGKGRDFKGKGKASESPSKASTRFQGKPSEPSSASASASVAADQAESSNSGVHAKPKRRVSFHDQVKVQEIEPINGPQSNFAKLVKSVGTKKALQMLKNGEFQDGDDVDDDDDDENDEDEDEGEEEDGEEMTEEEMQALLDGEYDSDDEEDAEEDEEEDDDDMSQASDESVNQGALTMRRLQKDLLDDDDNEDEDIPSNAITKNKKKGQQQQQSRYEARMAALSEQISALEAENVAEREWTMRGEVNARARPQNSLLEEDLEFDQAAKVVPVVTEESSLSLEELIKKRILDDQFDDVVRKSAVEAAAYIPSRLLDIKDTQNERSLAEIYADEFAAERRRGNGEEAETPEIDAKLEKEHEHIRVIFEDICTKLDSLSNAHFTPQVAQTTITTVSNVPSISLESAMPAAMSAASGLAPEEVYAPEHRGTLTAKSEMTPSQKKAARAKNRKARMQTQKVIDKYSSKSRNDKQAKERAMNSLIGKRGVTVVGKGKAAKSALTGKDRRERGSGPDTSGMSGAKFKL